VRVKRTLPMRPRLLIVAAMLACWSGGAFGGSTLGLRPYVEEPPWLPPCIYCTLPAPAKARVGIPDHLRGGVLGVHIYGFRVMALDDNEVEVRGRCWSACTLVVAYIPKSKLCFADDASLGFHMSRLPPPGSQPNLPGTASQPIPNSVWQTYQPSVEGTKFIYEQSPRDIQAWIDAKGGYAQMPMDGYWILTASELWKMGYRKCAD
jgi:hypothetical protein